MFVSQDLMFVKEGNQYLAYNSEYNKAIIISEKMYSHLVKHEKRSRDFSFLSPDDKESLIKHGVLYRDETSYNSKKYISILNQRDNTVEINTVYFHITQRCNLKCTYCYNKDNLNKPDLLTHADVLRIINELSELKVKRIIFTGGEILLRKDIVDICKYTSELGIKSEILSNGMLLNKRLEIFNYIEKMVISLDTLTDANNLRKGLNIPHLIKNLEKVPKEFKDKVIVRSVSSKPYDSDWEDVKELVENQLNMEYMLVPFIPNSHNDKKYMPDMSCFPLDSEDCAMSNVLCGASFKIIAIDSNGDIYPCQTLINPKYKIANIKDHSWLNVLKNSLITKNFQNRTVLNIEGCETCSIKYLCGGGCSAISESLYGDINKNSEVLCEYQKRAVTNKFRNILKTYG